jgi:hypothetical protein
MPSKNEKLLQEIKDNFQYALDSWRDIREEAKKDMRYVAGDPWEPAERAKRDDPNSKRPCLTFDELTQYVNQLINQVRQNPIAVKVSPKGNGATDKTAEMRQGIIRGIEYKSKAQAAYISAFENAAQRSYGFFVISTDYISENSFDQEIKVRRIPNPDSVLIDPDCKEADCSDMGFAYILDNIKQDSFENKYPNAEVKSFTPEMALDLPDWIDDTNKMIQVAEYWKVKKTFRTLLQLDEQTTAYLDEYPGAKLDKGEVVMKDGKRFPISNSRKCEERTVCQYITNGIEILEENEWAGKWIPIVPVFGKELYVDKGAGSKRVLISLIRMARDPYMMYCWLRSNEAEEASMTPKTPFICYEGQLEGHEDEWAKVTKEPLAFLQVKPVIDGASGNVLSLPERQPFQPNFAAYEVVCEATRRAIQAAMGISPLPTAAQRQNEKSGIALQRINQQEQIGSFHFIDNYKRSLEFAGRIYDDLIGKIYDTARDVGIRNPDESHETLKLNQPYEENGEQLHYDTSVGEHEITISTGPSYDSQREEVADFANTLAQTDLFPRIADLVIRLRNLGPLGDEMADRVTPPEFAKNSNPQAQLQQAAQKVQLQTQMIQEMQQELQKLQLEQKGKVIEMEAKKQMQAMDMELEKWKLDNARAIAEIQTKQQDISERKQMYMEIWQEIHGSAHEAGMQAADQAHEKQLADQQHQQALEQGQQGHEQALEQGDQAGQQQSALAQQQAENQPAQ